MAYRSLSSLFVAAFLVLIVTVSTGEGEERAPEISADRIKAAVAYLASDRLEGRGPGTRGEELTTDYLAGEYKKAGLKPLGQRGGYLQPVPLLRVTTSTDSTLRVTAKGKDTLALVCGEDFSGTSHAQTELEEFDAEAVFVGHGITAPEFGWDDYKGIDVKGKIVVLFTNEPPSDDPKFFGGKALTYYGRWTYKFEEAARRGAKACLIIHTPATAGYPYSVVRPLEGAQLKREKGQPALAFAGWLTREAGGKLLGLTGRTVNDALKQADTKGFRAYSLGLTLKGKIQSRVEKMLSNNVVGMVEGSDKTLKSECVIFTAHWDHLGIGRAVLGDKIYNGAADNATGCGLLLELARAWSALSPKPKRSAIFLAVTAEEKGLLGSKYYVQNPLVPLGKTALNLNFDMILPLGVPESVVVTGAERTTAWPVVKAAAKKNNLEIEEDQRAHLGIFYRSDHFSMARGGVPAFSVSAGMKIKDRPKDFAKKALEEFNDKAYHSPQDEMRRDWDFSGFVVLARFSLDVAREVADAERLPTWNEGDEFRPARQKSDAKSDLVAEGAKLEKLWGKGEFTEGPAQGPDGCVYFSDIGNRIMKYDPKKNETTVYRDKSGRANGLDFDPQGRLVACEGANTGGNRRISRTEKDGKITVLADKWMDKRFNSPNDLTIDSKGRVYFTDPRYVGDEKREIDTESVYRIADGKVTQIISDAKKPNGIALSPDMKTLYLADSDNGGKRLLLAYALDKDGNVGKRKELHDFGKDRGIDGMSIDEKGRIWATAGRDKTAGVYVFDADGKKLGFIATPETPTNCVFAGKARSTLYVTAGKSLYRIETTTKGFAVFWPDEKRK